MSNHESEAASQARLDNCETVQSYERGVDEYARTTSGEPSPAHGDLFRRFIRRVGRGGRVVEIGSGPGWDADRLEAEGIEVLRTDITQAFIDFQLRRGKRITELNVIDDALPGHNDGIVCLYVLQHVARPLIDAVLDKVSVALKPGGVFLVGLRLGSGEVREVGEAGGSYHITLWPQAAFVERLAIAGLLLEQSYLFAGATGEWLTVLACKA